MAETMGTYTCQQCGKEYQYRVTGANGKRYCSQTCYHASRRGIPSPRKMLAPERECALCGAPFTVIRSNLDQKFCSHRCSGLAKGQRDTVRAMSDTEAAWLAGLFDGEGSIIFPKGRNRASVRLTISNTHLGLLEHVLEVVEAGSIMSREKYRRSDHHKIPYQWQCYGQNARDVLHAMLPWLIAKKEKAEEVLQMAPTLRRPINVQLT